jgi:hypothetical protein
MFDYEQIAENAKDNREVYSVKNFKFLESKLTRRPHPEYSEPCYIFSREMDRTGLGLFHVPKFRWEHFPRFFVWFGLKRTIPEGMALVSKCGEWFCCQPAHLGVITPTEYFLRIYENRYPLPGRPNPNSKYDPREVLTVKFLDHIVKLPSKMISDIMDIPKHAVRRLASDRSWRHLEHEVIKMLLSFEVPDVNLRSNDWWYMNFREFIERYELFKPMIRTESPCNSQPNPHSGAIRRMQIVRERIQLERAESQ